MFQPGGGPRQPELDFDQILNKIRDGIGRVSQRLGGGGVGLAAALVVGLIIVIWAATAVTGIGGIALGSLEAWQAVLVGVQTVLVLLMIAFLEHASRHATRQEEQR